MIHIIFFRVNIVTSSSYHLYMARVWFDIMARMRISVKLVEPVEGQIRKCFTCTLSLISRRIIPWILLRRWLLLNLHFVVVRRGQFLAWIFISTPLLQPATSPKRWRLSGDIDVFFCFPLISPSLKSTVARRTPQQTPRASRQQMQFLRANGTNRHRGVFKGKIHTDHFPAEKKRDPQK